MLHHNARELPDRDAFAHRVALKLGGFRSRSLSDRMSSPRLERLFESLPAIDRK